MVDNVDGEHTQNMNVLELAGLEPIVRNLYSLKQQEAKVGTYLMNIVEQLYTMVYYIIMYANLLIIVERY